MMAIPTQGGPPRAICPGACYTAWAPDGTFLYVEVESKTRARRGRMIALPVLPETGLPELPEGGIRSAAQAASIRGSWIVEDTQIVPALDRNTYAFIRTTVHRNLFRVAVP